MCFYCVESPLCVRPRLLWVIRCCTHVRSDVSFPLSTVPGWAIFVTILVTSIVTVAITCAAPYVYRRIRYRNAYGELHQDLMAPIPT